ncbi:MAG: exosortase-associated EpsI family protein [Akkermansiaceae bacterium]|nr:exosortase-associated EpsI family protein [Akkermansiaceae bacterium]
MDLPDTSQSWQFNKTAASQEELGALSSDTEFSKAICLSARPGEYAADGRLVPDRVDLSIVLSGTDLNNSIHRPERCMPAQGHTILSSSDQPLKLPNGRQFNAKRLVSVQSQQVATATEREQYAKYNCVTYYFFVGHDRVTNNHLGRTFIDMKDRLIRGMDQRWLMLLFPCGMEKCHGLKRKSPSRRLIRKYKTSLLTLQKSKSNGIRL